MHAVWEVVSGSTVEAAAAAAAAAAAVYLHDRAIFQTLKIRTDGIPLFPQYTDRN